MTIMAVEETVSDVSIGYGENTSNEADKRILLNFLNYGLAVILGFIGVKLILHALHENSLPFLNGGAPIHGIPEIGIPVSLAVIAGTLITTVLASLIYSKRDSSRSNGR